MVLYPLSAFRAMNKAAEDRLHGHPPRRPSEATSSTRCRRATSCTTVLGYHAYEQHLDALFAARSRSKQIRKRQDESAMETGHEPTPPHQASNPRNPSLSRARSPATPRCAPSAARGNDLHYRGYDILDVARQSASSRRSRTCSCMASCRTPPSSPATRPSSSALRGAARGVKAALEQLPASAHPMDVMRTGVSALGCRCPEKDDHNTRRRARHRRPLMASLGSMLLYWYHFSHNGKRIDVETDDDSIGGHFLHLLHGERPSRHRGYARCTPR